MNDTEYIDHCVFEARQLALEMIDLIKDRSAHIGFIASLMTACSLEMDGGEPVSIDFINETLVGIIRSRDGLKCIT